MPSNLDETVKAMRRVSRQHQRTGRKTITQRHRDKRRTTRSKAKRILREEDTA